VQLCSHVYGVVNLVVHVTIDVAEHGQR